MGNFCEHDAVDQMGAGARQMGHKWLTYKGLIAQLIVWSINGHVTSARSRLSIPYPGVLGQIVQTLPCGFVGLIRADGKGGDAV